MTKKKARPSRRIHALLRKQPGLTTVEIHEALPDLDFGAVTSAVCNMVKRGEAEKVGMRTVQRAGKRRTTCKTYRAKNKRRVKVEEKAPTMTNTFQPVVAPPSTFEPIPPVSDSFRKAYEHLAMINSETMLELHETKKALAEAEKAHDCWWCKFKKVFV